MSMKKRIATILIFTVASLGIYFFPLQNESLKVAFASTASSTTYSTAGNFTWTAPLGVSTATVEAWGGGGGGGIVNNSGGGGGGGGAYAASSSVTLGATTTFAITVGIAGTADNAVAATNSTFATTTIVANAGLGTSDINPAKGGFAASSTAAGGVRYSGGDGAIGNETSDSGGGGGGAAGPAGVGLPGTHTTTTIGGLGGYGNNGSGGAGGAGGDGGNGSAGAANATGGGGGGGGDDGAYGGGGGAPGGGGGGSDKTGGNVGGVGQVKISYVIPSPPTVVLNSPDATSSVADTTPTLNFTGTAESGQKVEYEVQVATNIGFTDGRTEDSDTNVGGNSNNLKLYRGQSFTASVGGKISQAVFYLLSTDGTTGNIYAKLYNLTGTYGTDSKPTGSALATSDAYDASGLTGSRQAITFNFTGENQYQLIQATTYIIVVDFSGLSLKNVNIGGFATTDHSGNTSCSVDGSTWTAPDSQADLMFQVINSKTPLLDILSSSTDAGDFTAGHPFDSGTAINYTVSSTNALDVGITYYWRVRAKDPTGTNTYGDWSETRSFTVTSGAAVAPPQKRWIILDY